jgi:hypothetical protein
MSVSDVLQSHCNAIVLGILFSVAWKFVICTPEPATGVADVVAYAEFIPFVAYTDIVYRVPFVNEGIVISVVFPSTVELLMTVEPIIAFAV